MSRFAILLAGPIVATAKLRAAVAGARIVAADGGIGHAEALHLQPELWVGDFDSAAPALAARYAAIPREAYPTDKDRTDGEIAIEAALQRGATRLLLVGAFGGRSDHAFTHLILMLRYAARQGLAIQCFDGREEAFPLEPGEHRFEVEAGAAFSILKFTDLTGLTIRGARWPLTNVDVPFHSILTQSNESTGPVTVRLTSGTAVFLVQSSTEAPA